MTRFTDDMAYNTDSSDFVVRKRLPVSLQIICAFAVAFISIYVTALSMYEKGSIALFLCTLSITLGGLAGFSVYFAARLRDLVLATEFQNAMFASAAQLSTRFCLITKRDGVIVYFDPGFQKLFPHFQQSNNRTIDALLDASGVPADIVNKIGQMVQKQQNDRILLPLMLNGTLFPVMLSVDMLPRPKGYFLMRGRDYIENRTADTNAGLHAGAPLAHALNLLPEGIFIADAAGHLAYANATLESWLGYSAGEITESGMKSEHIVLQYKGHEAGRQVSGDFEGEILLQRKGKSQAAFYIRQVAFGKPAGITALIAPLEDVKKK